MDSSKILSGTEECSSSESGWTTYIASPDKEYEQGDGDDEDDGDYISVARQGYKKDEGEADSDDSMASDASSGPSDQGSLYRRSRISGHAGSKGERKYIAKKHNQQEEKKKKHHEQIMKGDKDKSGNRANSAGRLKKF